MEKKKKLGRPFTYGPAILKKAQEYVQGIIDTKERVGEDGKLEVKIPSIGGLAVHLGISRVSLYEWKEKYPEFREVMELLGSEQERRLIENGLSGRYVAPITKVLLTKHGYRDGQDITSDGKRLPAPLLSALAAEEEKTED